MKSNLSEIISSISRIILISLGVAFYYCCYRYIFQYNAEATSPTYTNTPLYLQAGKYLILFVLFCVALIKFLGEIRIPMTNLIYIISIFIFFIQFFMSFVVFEIRALCSLLFFSVIIFAGMIPLYIDTERIQIFIYRFCIFAIIYELLQIVLFFKYGRLPALAYPDSWSVRFGGPWDDPNGFGIYIAFMLPFTMLYAKTKIVKCFWMLCWLLCLILTQSMTAIFAVCLALMVVFNLHPRKSFLRISFTIFLIACGYFYFYFYFHDSWINTVFIEAKQSSIDGHFSYIDEIPNLNSFELLFGGNRTSSENDFARMTFLYGLLFCFVYFIFLCLILVQSFHKIHKYKNIALYPACFSFQIAFILSMFNLPVTIVFPINYLFFLSVALLYGTPKIELEAC